MLWTSEAFSGRVVIDGSEKAVKVWNCVVSPGVLSDKEGTCLGVSRFKLMEKERFFFFMNIC